MSKRKKLDIFENVRIGNFSLDNKPTKDNTLIDITVIDKFTFARIKKIKKRPVKKALEELRNILDLKG